MRPPTLFPPQERVTLLEVGLSIRWSRRVIIELRFSGSELTDRPLGRRTGFWRRTGSVHLPVKSGLF